ncbi:hypothetical protein ASE31_12130 [Acidovorax sp. Root217]|nr:hypothetical protein ASE31_12130 [Acidovorax sp. Root217]
MNTIQKNIATALFMAAGAMAGVLIMVLMMPERDRGLSELKLGLAIGACMGYVCIRLAMHFFDKHGR